MTETPDNNTGAEKAAVDSAVAFVSDWLDYWFPRANILGLSLAIRHGGDLVLDKAWGYADLEKKEKLTPQHIFRVASNSKMFTATAIMLLQQQGKLALDDPVGKFLPWLAPASDALKNVTIRQLLNYTAGLPRDGSFSDFWNLEHDFPDEASFREQTIKMSPLPGPEQLDLPFDGSSAPPHEMKYSNWGYGLLGQVIEQISGESYAGFVQKNVIDPLQLHHTSAEAGRVAPQDLVTSYGRAVDGVNPAFPPSINTGALAAATGFCSTAGDLAHFLVARASPADSVLNEASRGELLRQFNDVADAPGMAYGLGLIRQKVGEHDFYGHAGGFPGQVTYTLYDPKLKIAVGLCANVDRAAVRGMMNSVLGALAFKIEHPEEGAAKQYEGRYQTIRDCFYVMASGDKILALNPELNEPWPAKPVLLSPNPSGGYTIKGSTGTGHDGEEIVFGPQNGKPGAKYAGVTLLKMQASP